MCDNEFRNLIIIGNGFDKSLHLKSSFSDYLLDPKHKFECDKIFYFIRKYNDYVIDLGRRITKACNVIYSNIHVKPLFNTNKNDYQIDSESIAYNYFNVRLCLKRFVIGYNDLSIKLYTNKDIVDHPLIRFEVYYMDSICNNMIKDLENLSNNIDVNFWYLLLTFQKYRYLKEVKCSRNACKNKYGNVLKRTLNQIFSNIDTQTILDDIFSNKSNKLLQNLLSNRKINRHTKLYIKLILKNISIDMPKNFFTNWSDVENTIKYFMTAQYNMPKWHPDNFHRISYYFGEKSLNSEEYFTFYVYVCEMINSLGDLIGDYPLKGKSDYLMHIDNNNVDVYSIRDVYKYILYHVNNKNYEKDILSPYKNNYNTGICLLMSYVAPFVFLLQNNFNHDLILSDISFNNMFRHMYPFKYSFFTKQIYYFEKDFGDYLKHQISLYPNYKLISKKLLFYMSQIPDRISSNQDNNGNSFGVIDFNYTPLDSHIFRDHIHGSLRNKNIIIGIGDTDIYKLIDRTRKKIRYMNKLLLLNKYQDNDINRNIKMIDTYSNNIAYYNKLLKLSKTNRILGMNKQQYENSFTNESLNHVKNIIFFGHSFGINDYPYFEAIFDKANIYKSDIRLIFCYSKFFKGDKSIYRRKAEIPNIIKMLRSYSKTFTNHNHGENLISKMLLENRLLFYDISSYFGY